MYQSLKKFQTINMESSDTLDCAVSVKEEPSDKSLAENYWDTVDEKPDLKNFQLLLLLEDNSILRKCDENHESKLNNEVKIVFECEDVKPKIDVSIVKRIDYYSQNHLQHMKYSDNDKTQDTIEIEPAGEVERDTFGDDAEKWNLNYNCERSEKIQKRRITKKVENNHNNNLKIHIDAMHNGVKYVCVTCGKTFKHKVSLKIHINAMHNGMAPTCDICGKKFQTKDKLKIHIDGVHNGVKHACGMCEKTFTQKGDLKIHIDGHNGVRHACGMCGKSFTQKPHLKMHIDAMHNGMAPTCEICGKKFARKNTLKIHIDGVHNGVKHACSICGKTFSQKGDLKLHVDSIHNNINYACGMCAKTFSRKDRLKIHMDSVHNEIIRECDK